MCVDSRKMNLLENYFFKMISALVISKARPQFAPEFSCDQNALSPLLSYGPSHWLLCCPQYTGEGDESHNQTFPSDQPAASTAPETYLPPAAGE